MAVVTTLVHEGKPAKLFRAIVMQKPEFSFAVFQRLLRKKDIKVNGKRVSENVDVEAGDEIAFYLSEQKQEKSAEIVFEDDNILIANKPDGIEVESETDENDFLHLVAGEGKLFAVHRLDRNTTGLVVFAKNLKAKKELDEAFKNRTVHKYYLARVFGYMEKKSADLVAFLKKDERAKRAVVRAVPAPNKYF